MASDSRWPGVQGSSCLGVDAAHKPDRFSGTAQRSARVNRTSGPGLSRSNITSKGLICICLIATTTCLIPILLPNLVPRSRSSRGTMPSSSGGRSAIDPSFACFQWTIPRHAKQSVCSALTRLVHKTRGIRRTLNHMLLLVSSGSSMIQDRPMARLHHHFCI